MTGGSKPFPALEKDMKIIIIGSGKTGFALAKMLADDNHDITVVDKDASRIDSTVNSIDVFGVAGSGTNPDVLREAGAEEADLLVASTAQDEVNMVACITARKLGTKHVIARMRDPQYLSQKEFMREALGLSTIINPEYECAKEISRILRFPSAARVDAFSKGSVEIMEYKVPEGSALCGVKLQDLPGKFGAKVLVPLAERGNEAFIPNGAFELRAGDNLHISGASTELRKFFIAAGLYRKPVKNVMLVGGSRISVYLTGMLERSGMSVTIIEKDPAVCETLTELTPHATIINGDATKNDILLEQGLGAMDAFVSLMGNDEDNIITSLYAKHVNVGKVVTKVNHEKLSGMLESLGLDSIVTPKEINAQIITCFARAMSNSEGGSMETLRRFANGDIEAMEFRVEEGSDCIGVPLKSLKLKKNVLISAIIRGSESIIPGGDSVIRAGDHAVVVSAAGRLRTINDILQD